MVFVGNRNGFFLVFVPSIGIFVMEKSALLQLRRKGKPIKRSSEINRMKGGKNSHDRPKEIEERKRLGDWEIDAICHGWSERNQFSNCDGG